MWILWDPWISDAKINVPIQLNTFHLRNRFSVVCMIWNFLWLIVCNPSFSFWFQFIFSNPNDIFFSALHKVLLNFHHLVSEDLWCLNRFLSLFSVVQLHMIRSGTIPTPSVLLIPCHCWARALMRWYAHSGAILFLRVETYTHIHPPTWQTVSQLHQDFYQIRTARKGKGKAYNARKAKLRGKKIGQSEIWNVKKKALIFYAGE